MNWSLFWTGLSAVATAIGASGTIIGLFYINKQLKNIKDNQEANAIQTIADSERDLWKIVMDDSEMIDLTAHHLDLGQAKIGTAPVKPRSILNLILFIRQYEAIYYQYKKNMIPEEIWKQWKDSMGHTFSDPRIVAILYHTRIGFNSKFRDFVKTEILPNINSLTD
ncbi:hypothetical protein [Herpetosiphon sp. NSE202]|uniref:hypothetical protein n=1 Tax=Herpetosiphon sp. NSE202 TaxID=3351349 RepID=UPI00363C8FAF